MKPGLSYVGPMVSIFRLSVSVLYTDYEIPVQLMRVLPFKQPFLQNLSLKTIEKGYHQLPVRSFTSYVHTGTFWKTITGLLKLKLNSKACLNV